MRKNQFNQKSFDYLIGDSSVFYFEQRIFNMLNLLGIFAVVFAAGLGYFMYKDWSLVFSILLFSILPFLAYYAGRVYKRYQLAQTIFYTFIHFFFLFLWFQGGGIASSFLLLLFNIGLWMLLFSVKNFYPKVIFNFLFLIVLILISLWYPDLIDWVPVTKLQKGLSHIGSYLIIGVYSYSIVYLFIKEFKKEQEALRAANEKLNGLNTSLIKSKQELEKTNALRNKLFSVVSHDMRSLVGNVNNFSELLIDPDASIDDQAEFEIKNSIYDSSNSLMEMVDNLLFWARIQMDAVTINKQDVPIKNVITSCVRVYKHNLEDKEIQLISNFNHPFIVFVDIEILRVIIRNLLSNAIKFSNNGGEIRLSLESIYNNHIRFSVEDDGLGMSQEELAAIQDANNYFSTTRAQNEHGTGLGLEIVHEFAKSLGGSLEIESEKGKGSCFSLILPNQQNDL